MTDRMSMNIVEHVDARASDYDGGRGLRRQATSDFCGGSVPAGHAADA